MADSDSVEYFIFLDNRCDPSTKKLYQIHDELISFATGVTKNYIWQKDEFTIRTVIPSGDEDFIPHLHGATYLGGNVADEWFIVYLLMSFSRKRDDFVIRIFDDDGEFLLLEAADELPKWIESKELNYQTYIHDGSVRILPGTFSTRKNTIRYIIERLQDANNCVNVEAMVTKRIDQKIENYSNNLDSFFHKTRLHVPAKIAAILDTRPDLISKAVIAYQNFKSDPTLTNSHLLKQMQYFPPVDMTVRLVTFTKYLYAMISCSRKDIPDNRRSWNFPSSSTPNFKEHELGYLITCGFEILASRSDTKWIRYVGILKKKDYFKGLLKDSKEYVELEKKAKSFFFEKVNVDDDDKKLLTILLNTSYDYEKFKREESNLPPSDDDKWMEISEEELNKLTESYNAKKACSVNEPHELVSKLTNFLKRHSDVEGVEVENNEGIASTMETDGDSNENQIKFNVDEFFPAMNEMLNALNLDNKSESDESSDFYSDNDESDSDDDKDTEIQSLMDIMDKELQTSTIFSNVFSKSNQENSEKSYDIDTNIFENMMKSYGEECGRPGPAGNVLYGANLTSDKRGKGET